MAVIDFDWSGPTAQAAQSWQRQEDKKADEKRQRQYAQEDAERPLSDYEKSVGRNFFKMMNGELSPKEAAIADKLEEQERPQPAKDPASLWSQGGLSAGPMTQDAQQTYETARGGWLPPQAGLSAPPPPPQMPQAARPPPEPMPEPRTARDFDQGLRALPHLQRGATAQENAELRWAIAQLRAKTAEENNKRNNNTRGSAAAAALNQRVEEEKGRNQRAAEVIAQRDRALAVARKRFEIFAQRGAEAKDLQRYKQLQDNYKIAADNYYGMVKSYISGPDKLDPAKQKMDEAFEELAAEDAELNEKYFGPQAQSSQGSSTSYSVESERVPQGAKPPIDTSTNVREPGQTPPSKPQGSKPQGAKPNSAVQKLQALKAAKGGR